MANVRPVAVAVAVLLPALVCAGCWGDEVRSLDRVGAVRAPGDKVMVLFEGCPGERVERVVLNLTDDDFEEIEDVLWEVQAVDGSTSVDSMVVGEVANGFREVTDLRERLEPDDHVQLVVTSTRVGTIPMSFTVGDLRSGEVLVHDSYRDNEDFAEEAASSC